jgi:DNA polymerase phi
VFDQLLALLRNSNMTKQDDWVWSILEFLLVHGLFVVSKANKKSDVLTVSRWLWCRLPHQGF